MTGREATLTAGGRAEAIAEWERAGLCWRCGHGIDAHGPLYGCDHEVRDYGEMDCGCEEYPAPAVSAAAVCPPRARGERG